MNRFSFCSLFLLTVTLFAGCKKETPEAAGKGNLMLSFDMQINGTQLVTNVMNYTNAAGNPYEVNEVKFFISELKLYKNDGSVVRIQADNSIHYYDWDIENTHTWNIADDLPSGTYDSISFTFGLPPEKNISGYFVNPPENNMSWPSVLGGGYHYMQINGRWRNLQDSVRVLNFHTGIGQIYDNGEVTEYVPNHFQVVLPHSFQIQADGTTTLDLVMNINSWFTTPHDYDFNVWGGSIMQNQAAQEVIKENGHDVFSVTSFSSLKDF
ncbi:MAG TPA: hypothetical protein PKK66_01100 [Bacteroidales bacterium]|nr:hypothetical protein [Bacteroidales bacterium]HPT51842.1 hypothetical protein [Bacteroidales bacterium]